MSTTNNPTAPQTTEPAHEYWAFISYSHDDNHEHGRQWATWLHQRLEQYEVPLDLVGTKNRRGEVIPAQIYPVFRDEEELAVSGNLSEELTRALEQSRNLVTVCSPRALKSRHVSREVAHFKSLGRSDKIFCMIVDGKPNASQSEDPDLWELECFVPPLLFDVDEDGKLTSEPVEPLAADARYKLGDNPSEQGWTLADEYRQHLAVRLPDASPQEIDRLVSEYRAKLERAILKIIAGILGVPLRELTERDKAYQLEKARQRNRIAMAVAGFMAFLALAAVVSGIVALRNERKARVAQGKALLNQAASHLDAAEYPQTQMVAAKALGFSQFDGEEKPSRGLKFWRNKDYPEALLPNDDHYASLVSKLDRIASGQVSAALSPLPVWCSPRVPLPPREKENPVWATVFSPDYQWAATGCEDGRIRVYSWTAADAKPRMLPHPGPHHQAIRDMKLSADGGWLAVAYEGPKNGKDFVVVWRIHKNNPRIPQFTQSHIFDYNHVAALDWSPDHEWLVTAGGPTYGTGKVALWKMGQTEEKPVLEHKFPGRWVNDVKWSPTGDSIALACQKMVQLVDPKNLQPISEPLTQFDDGTSFTSIAYGEKADLIAAGTTTREVFLFTRENADYTLAANQSVHRYPVRNLAFDPSGDRLFTSSSDGNIRIWNTKSAPELELEASLLADSSSQSENFPAVRSLVTSPEGNFLFTGLFDGTARLWALGNRQSLVIHREGNVESVSYSPENRFLLTAREKTNEDNTHSGVFRAYDLNKETLLWENTYQIPKRSGFALRLETMLLPGGNRALLFHRPLKAGDPCIKLVDIQNGHEFDAIAAPDSVVPLVVDFSAEGNRIVLATKQATAYAAAWDDATSKLPQPEDFVKIKDAEKGLNDSIDVWDIDLANDGKHAALVGRHKVSDIRQSFVHLLDMEKAKANVHTDVGPNVAMCVDFHPNNKELAVGTYDRRLIYILDLKGNQLGKPLRGHDRGITAVNYNKDGTMLASGSQLQVRLWDVQARATVASLYAHRKIVQDFAWEPQQSNRPPRLITGAEDQTLKFWPLPVAKPNLKSYLSDRLLAPAWLVFDDGDDTLRWNTEMTPHRGFKNLPQHSTIGQIDAAPDAEDTTWQLYIESVSAGNWDSAEILYRQLNQQQKQRPSLALDQSVGRLYLQLKELAERTPPPIDLIKKRNRQIKILQSQNMELRQRFAELEEKAEAGLQAAPPGERVKPK